MAYLILRIEPCENDTLSEKDSKPIVEQIAVRVRLDAAAQPDYFARIRSELAVRGYEMPENFIATARSGEWPFTSYTYISQNREGMGRVASDLKRIPVRRLLK